MSIDAETRLRNERTLLKSELPNGFFARPVPIKQNNQLSKTELDYFTWICGIPGRSNSLYDGCTLLLYLFFPKDYPKSPPKCQFDPPLFHPNIYPSGSICLSLINKETWKQDVSIKSMLVGIQMLLDEPNISSPAQQEAFQCLKSNRTLYDKKVKEFVHKFPTTGFKDRIQKLVNSGEFRTTIQQAVQINRNNQILDFD
ncbi:Ubiquitin-conjugating enzyme [Spironucleus salmonicida]|uniref:Ubiquitin-conjugating enzyme n=1 Tax=Spironucleus salmonicida TaxID=348837 RepID=V6LLF9_9EUKA|nr:Ubiquitin-conjugating enzyme [Spironucleus salmonicida]|eukprot:EST44591.1 Ubiquitin-conjugating enzyme [Spironucleus salmonicida]